MHFVSSNFKFKNKRKSAVLCSPALAFGGSSEHFVLIRPRKKHFEKLASTLIHFNKRPVIWVNLHKVNKRIWMINSISPMETNRKFCDRHAVIWITQISIKFIYIFMHNLIHFNVNSLKEFLGKNLFKFYLRRLLDRWHQIRFYFNYVQKFSMFKIINLIE